MATNLQNDLNRLNEIHNKYETMFKYMDRQQIRKEKNIEEIKRHMEQEASEVFIENLKITKLMFQFIKEFDDYRLMLFDKFKHQSDMIAEIKSIITREDYVPQETPTPIEKNDFVNKDIILEDEEIPETYGGEDVGDEKERLNEIKLILEETGGPISLMKMQELAKKFNVNIQTIEDDVELIMSEEMDKEDDRE